MGKNAGGGPVARLRAGFFNFYPSLIIGVLQRPAGTKNGHDDNPLAKVSPIAQTKLTGGSAFWRGRWPEFLYGLFGL